MGTLDIDRDVIARGFEKWSFFQPSLPEMDWSPDILAKNEHSYVTVVATWASTRRNQNCKATGYHKK